VNLHSILQSDIRIRPFAFPDWNWGMSTNGGKYIEGRSNGPTCTHKIASKAMFQILGRSTCTQQIRGFTVHSIRTSRFGRRQFREVVSLMQQPDDWRGMTCGHWRVDCIVSSFLINRMLQLRFSVSRESQESGTWALYFCGIVSIQRRHFILCAPAVLHGSVWFAMALLSSLDVRIRFRPRPGFMFPGPSR
jgi:hypothetical protein